MKYILLITSFFVITFSAVSQDLVYFNNGKIVTGEFGYDTNKYSNFIKTDSGDKMYLEDNKVKYVIEEYEYRTKLKHFYKATRYYNTSTWFLIGSAGSYLLYGNKQKKFFLITGIGLGAGALAFKIAGDQQFKKIGRLMEIEIAADKLGMKITF